MPVLKTLLLLAVAWLSVAPDLLLLLLQRTLTTKSLLNTFYWKFKRGKMAIDSGALVKLIQSLRDTQDEIQFAWSNSLATRQSLQKHLKAAYHFIPHSDLILTALGTLSVAWFLRRSLHRYKNANDLPLSFFEGKRQKRLNGLAVSVNDSDNIRFYHRPHFYSLFKPALARQDLKFQTINVRLAGIDAPEMAHFGTKSQPFAAEAKEWLTQFVQGRSVRIQLHRIDQYGRAVATVWVHRRRFPWLWWPVWWNVSLEMVRAGFATIYRDLGAEYNGTLAELEAAEVKARRLKLGMWQQGKAEYQSPGDFKRANRLHAALQKSQTTTGDLKMTKIDFFSSQQQHQKIVACK